MSAKIWIIHAGKLLLFFSAALIVGWFSGHPGKTLLAATIAYAGWHLVNIWRLHNWLHQPQLELPRGLGIWSELFSEVGALNRRSVLLQEQCQSLLEDFHSLADAFPDAALVLDHNDCIEWFNTAAGELLGLETPDDLSKPVTRFLRDPGFANWLPVSDEVKSGLEMPSPRSEGGWLEVAGVPIREKQRLIILRNVTEVHKVEQIRRDFVTNVSHELRTPLTVLLGYLEIFQDRPEDEMTDALQRMHTQAVQEKAVDIPELLNQLEAQAAEISRGRHILRFDVDNDLKLLGIAPDLESAFRNLIVNALKYTPDGGCISITWKDGAEGPMLIVSDTGIGIPLREIPRLTERFYRVSSHRGRDTGGTGLGLSIVKHVLNAHQARLDIESEYGVGSRFTCIFPQERKKTD
jgi:two-component system phosphate regulon sensor histidine kinase PhoR